MSLPAKTCGGKLSLSTEIRLQQWCYLTFIILRHCGTLNLPSPTARKKDQPQDLPLPKPNTSPSTQPTILPSSPNRVGHSLVIWQTQISGWNLKVSEGTWPWVTWQMKRQMLPQCKVTAYLRRTIAGLRRESLVDHVTSPIHLSSFSLAWDICLGFSRGISALVTSISPDVVDLFRIPWEGWFQCVSPLFRSFLLLI